MLCFHHHHQCEVTNDIWIENGFGKWMNWKIYNLKNIKDMEISIVWLDRFDDSLRNGIGITIKNINDQWWYFCLFVVFWFSLFCLFVFFKLWVGYFWVCASQLFQLFFLLLFCSLFYVSVCLFEPIEKVVVNIMEHIP